MLRPGVIPLNTPATYTKNYGIENCDIFRGILDQAFVGKEVKSCRPELNITMYFDWEDQRLNRKRGDLDVGRNSNDDMRFKTCTHLLIRPSIGLNTIRNCLCGEEPQE